MKALYIHRSGKRLKQQADALWQPWTLNYSYLQKLMEQQAGVLQKPSQSFDLWLGWVGNLIDHNGVTLFFVFFISG